MEIGTGMTFDAALHGDGKIVLADASGEAYQPLGAGMLRILIGPEGGWTREELRRADECGVRVCRFGRNIMRIEVAAAISAGIVLAAEEALKRGRDTL